VRRELVTERTRDFGYRVSEAQIHEAIRNEPAFQVDGKYSPDVAKARLASAGITIEAFEADLRRSLQGALLQNAIRISDFATPRELEQFAALRGQQREVAWAVLPADKFAGSQPFDAAAVQQYYEKNRARFMTTETARVRYAELRLDQVAPQVTVADADVRAFYDKNKDRYVEPEKRRARHILITSQGGSDDAAALKKAQEALTEARAGKDFSELARKYSQDPGSASKGGDLGWADKSAFVGPFADALFSMQPNEIRGPVKTQFGYHVIRLDEVQGGKGRSFDEAKAEIESQLRRERAADVFGDKQEQMQVRIEQGASDIDVLAKEFGLQVGEVAAFARGSGSPELGATPEVQDLVFSDAVLNQRKVGGPINVGEDRLVVLKVLDHRKSEPKPLADVRPEIVAALRAERGAAAALQAAQEAQRRIESGATVEQVAKDLGVKAESPRFVGRNDPAVSAELRSLAFELPKPADKPVARAALLKQGAPGAVILAVTAVRVDPAAAAPGDARLLLAREVAARNGTGDAQAYVEEMRRTAKVSKNPKVFE
jgi:peptidyl-prolyl cis-trans isomerase D